MEIARLRRGSHRVPVWFLGDVEEPMADRHRLVGPYEAHTEYIFMGPYIYRCLLLRPGHRQHKALVLCQRRMSFCNDGTPVFLTHPLL